MAEAAAAADKGDKPIRVMEGEVVVLARCPLCTKPITAQVEVEVRLGPLTIGKSVDGETGEIPVDVSAQPRLRRLQIEHECRAKPVAARTRKPRTPRTTPEVPPMPIEVHTEDAHTGEEHDDVLRTPSGKVLTEEEIQRLSDEEAARAEPGSQDGDPEDPEGEGEWNRA